MDTSHKHRKGFREDAEMLSEAYDSVYTESWGRDELAGLSDAELGVKGAVKLQKGTTIKTLPKGHRDIQRYKDEGFRQILPPENEEGELSDDWEKPNYRGDQHFFQPGEIVEVGPWGENDEYHHLEVVLQIKGDVINTIPITDDAYGMQYGGRGGADISLIRPQSEIDYDHGDFKPADGREW